MTRRVTELDHSHLGELTRFLADDGGYTRRVFGRPPSPKDAVAVLERVPPTVDRSAKITLGLWRADYLVAVADLVVGHPSPEVAFVGLLQVHPEHRGQGAGRALHHAILERVRTRPGITRLRLAVVATNADAADPFWWAVGYAPTGESSEWIREDGMVTRAVYWERTP